MLVQCILLVDASIAACMLAVFLDKSRRKRYKKGSRVVVVKKCHESSLYCHEIRLQRRAVLLFSTSVWKVYSRVGKEIGTYTNIISRFLLYRGTFLGYKKVNRLTFKLFFFICFILFWIFVKNYLERTWSGCKASHFFLCNNARL